MSKQEEEVKIRRANKARKAARKVATAQAKTKSHKVKRVPIPASPTVRKVEALAIVGLGETVFDDGVRKGIIPAPFKLRPGGRAVGWDREELMAYRAARIAERDEKHLPPAAKRATEICAAHDPGPLPALRTPLNPCRASAGTPITEIPSVEARHNQLKSR